MRSAGSDDDLSGSGDVGTSEEEASEEEEEEEKKPSKGRRTKASKPRQPNGTDDLSINLDEMEAFLEDAERAHGR